MSDQEFILAPPTVKVNFALEPVLNQLNTLSLLNQAEDLSGFGQWVSNTLEAMSEERRHNNHMVLGVLLDWDDFIAQPDFEAGIEMVRQTDGEKMWGTILGHLEEKSAGMDVHFDDDHEARVRDDVDYYLDILKATVGKHYEQKGKTLNLALYKEVHRLFKDPQQMVDLTVEHLTHMWEHYLKGDWEQSLPLLTESMMAFRQMDFRGQTAIDTIRMVTGRDLSGYWTGLDNANNITFVPSAHIGPYVVFHGGHNKKAHNVLLFGARVPEGISRSQALGRAELLVRLNALADDTRLKILELMTQHDEVCAQDIITWLDLSQSSASRHLRQLTATGYINERRREVAKCYTLNRDRVDDTLFALKRFLKM